MCLIFCIPFLFFLSAAAQTQRQEQAEAEASAEAATDADNGGDVSVIHVSLGDLGRDSVTGTCTHTPYTHIYTLAHSHTLCDSDLAGLKYELRCCPRLN